MLKDFYLLRVNIEDNCLFKMLLQEFKIVLKRFRPVKNLIGYGIPLKEIMMEGLQIYIVV